MEHNKTLTEIVMSYGYRLPTSKELTQALISKHIKELANYEGKRHLCLRDVRRRNFLRTFIRVSSN